MKVKSNANSYLENIMQFFITQSSTWVQIFGLLSRYSLNVNGGKINIIIICSQVSDKYYTKTKPFRFTLQNRNMFTSAS